MEIIRGLCNLHLSHHGCVATIGNFDGVHLGHQQVLRHLAEQARIQQVPMLVITFEPHPQEYFFEDRALPRLTRFREKIEALRQHSVDRVLCLRFDAKMANMSAEDFVSKILVQGIGVRYLVVGDDFRFGFQRHGNFSMLQEAGKKHDFPVINLSTFFVDQERVSSTRIRNALFYGDLKGAKALLGRPYRMAGRVAHGDKRGRGIGFPTANLFLHRRSTPLTGVYAVEMFGFTGEPWPGVANLGFRPTVGGGQALLEVHLLRFSGNLYGQHVEVDFLRKIREEKRFSSFEELRLQILRDVLEADPTRAI